VSAVDASSGPVASTIGVVGAGTMGSGIAQLAALAGARTLVFDAVPEGLEKGVERLKAGLAKGAERERWSEDDASAAAARVEAVDGLEDLAPCALVIEAIAESLEAKRGLFEELADVVDPACVLATNTSSLSVTDLAAAVPGPERVVGMHFFNPAPLMPLVEIVRAERTSDEAFETAYALGERLGKHPIRCHDTPGFVVNRILIPLLNDCVRVLDEARVTPESLDAAMTNGAGWPMGPCTLVDLVGIDVHVHASEALYEKLREPRMAPPPRLVAMRNAGLLGRKSGRGFYTY